MMHTWRLKCQRSHPRGSPRTPCPLKFQSVPPRWLSAITSSAHIIFLKSGELAQAGLMLPFAACCGRGYNPVAVQMRLCSLDYLAILAVSQLPPAFHAGFNGFKASGRGGLNKDRPNTCRVLFVFQMWLSSDPSTWVSVGISNSAGLA